jgi:hypothetical protein
MYELRTDDSEAILLAATATDEGFDRIEATARQLAANGEGASDVRLRVALDNGGEVVAWAVVWVTPNASFTQPSRPSH